MQDLRKMKNLRSLAVSKTSSQQLSPDDFLEFGVELENLKIFRGELRGIKNNAFMHVRGLKRLDLSENRIDTIEKDAFEEVRMLNNYLTLFKIHKKLLDIGEFSSKSQIFLKILN